MLLLIIVLILVGVVLLASGAYFVVGARRPTGGNDLEPHEPEAAVTPSEGAADVVEQDEAEAPRPVEEPTPEEPTAEEPAIEQPPATFWGRLGKARSALAGYLGSVLSRGGVDDQTWEELEEALILADVGVPTTVSLMDGLKTQASDQGITEPRKLVDALKDELKAQLGGHDLDLRADGAPAVWLFVGVNGVGKTTTIGKLAHREVGSGRSVVLAAGDTFRAAAAEQLETWAGRADATIIRGAEGADPSSVVFDAVEHAAAKPADLVMADTAGRLHTKTNLMEELRKVRRVAEKGPGTVTEVLLVIDATTGQNGLVQAQQFADAVDVTGVVLTKLDGSAKGGIVLAIQNELGIPVKLVGLGEGIDDLITFDAGEFVDAIFDEEQADA